MQAIIVSHTPPGEHVAQQFRRSHVCAMKSPDASRDEGHIQSNIPCAAIGRYSLAFLQFGIFCKSSSALG